MRPPILIVLPILIMTLAGCSWSSHDRPLTEKRRVTDEYHGITVTDDYRWLDDLKDLTIVNPLDQERENAEGFNRFTSRLWQLRQRKGMMFDTARLLVRQRAYYAALMVETGAADGLVTGLTTGYAEAIRAPLQIIGTRAGARAALARWRIWRGARRDCAGLDSRVRVRAAARGHGAVPGRTAPRGRVVPPFHRDRLRRPEASLA